jgi:hypothetical protein
MGLASAVVAPASRNERQRPEEDGGPRKTFSISIAVKIHQMGHMVNFVFDGESLSSRAPRWEPRRSTWPIFPLLA